MSNQFKQKIVVIIEVAKHTHKSGSIWAKEYVDFSFMMLLVKTKNHH